MAELNGPYPLGHRAIAKMRKPRAPTANGTPASPASLDPLAHASGLEMSNPQAGAASPSNLFSDDRVEANNDEADSDTSLSDLDDYMRDELLIWANPPGLPNWPQDTKEIDGLYYVVLTVILDSKKQAKRAPITVEKILSGPHDDVEEANEHVPDGIQKYVWPEEVRNSVYYAESYEEAVIKKLEDWVDSLSTDLEDCNMIDLGYESTRIDPSDLGLEHLTEAGVIEFAISVQQRTEQEVEFAHMPNDIETRAANPFKALKFPTKEAKAGENNMTALLRSDPAEMSPENAGNQIGSDPLPQTMSPSDSFSFHKVVPSTKFTFAGSHQQAECTSRVTKSRLDEKQDLAGASIPDIFSKLKLDSDIAASGNPALVSPSASLPATHAKNSISSGNLTTAAPTASKLLVEEEIRKATVDVVDGAVAGKDDEHGLKDGKDDSDSDSDSEAGFDFSFGVTEKND